MFSSVLFRQQRTDKSQGYTFPLAFYFPFIASPQWRNSPCYDSYDLRCLLPAALLLCILSVKGLYKMGLLGVLFNFSMGLCLSKLHANSVRKRNATKLLLGKGKKDLLYTLALMLITPPPFKSQLNSSPTIAWEIHRAFNQRVGYFTQNVACPWLFKSFGED